MTDIDVKYKAFDRDRVRYGRKLWTVREAIDWNNDNPDKPPIWYLMVDGAPHHWTWNERSRLFDGKRVR